MTGTGLAGLCLCKSECLDHWRSLVGPQEIVEATNGIPNSIQSLFGEDLRTSSLNNMEMDKHVKQNNIFSCLSLDPVFQDEAVSVYLNENVVPTLLPALSELLIQRPQNPVMWLADWLTLNNPVQTPIHNAVTTKLQ